MPVCYWFVRPYRQANCCDSLVSAQAGAAATMTVLVPLSRAQMAMETRIAATSSQVSPLFRAESAAVAAKIVVEPRRPISSLSVFVCLCRISCYCLIVKQLPGLEHWWIGTEDPHGRVLLLLSTWNAVAIRQSQSSQLRLPSIW
jgi:hypothetical protein